MSEIQSKKPTQEVIDACLQELCVEIIGAQADKDAACIKKTGQDEVWQYKVCCLEKAQDHLQAYQSLNLLVAAPIQKHSLLIKENVKTSITKSEELGEHFKGTVKCVKQVKTILEEAIGEACKFDRCWEEEERCNPDLFKVLQKLEIDGIPFKAALDNLADEVTTCYNYSRGAFNAGIEIVGLQTFANVESLEGVSKELCEKVDTLKANIDTNIKSSETDVTKASGELMEIIIERKATENERCTAAIAYSGIQEGLNFVCADKCPAPPSAWKTDPLEEALNDLCKEINGKVDTGDHPSSDYPIFHCCKSEEDSHDCGGNGGGKGGENNGNGSIGGGSVNEGKRTKVSKKGPNQSEKEKEWQ